MEFPTKEFIETIQILHPDIVSFLTYNTPKIAKQWRRDKYLFRAEPKYLDIKNFILYADRIQNLMVNGRIKKTDLLMAFRSEMAISEKAARRIMQEAIDDGELIEERDFKIKWISPVNV